jgi:hypothetical protein
MKDFTATIRKGSPREQEWLKVLGGNVAILRSPIPTWRTLPSGNALCFELDLQALTGDQRKRLVQHLAEKFSVPAEEVEADLGTIGVPILDEDVTVTVFNPMRWV